jgi:hypothetical protein
LSFNATSALPRVRVAKFNYVEIESPKLKEAYRDEYWPSQYRPIRDQMEKRLGTPRFLIVKDGKLLGREWGAGEWERNPEEDPGIGGLRGDFGLSRDDFYNFR